MLFQDRVNIVLGNKKIINDCDISISQETKYGIIGQNGVGKTTLMNYIYEKTESLINVLYIKQTEIISDNCSIYEYMLKSNEKLYNIFTRYNELDSKNNIKELDDVLFNEYIKLSDELCNENFKKYESQIIKILNGLGFYILETKVNLLSGGQHTKLSLCKALLLEPELLLLDEPTNHLDLKNILWLERYLLDYKNSIIIISHNIDFIDSLCEKNIYFFNYDPQNPQVYFCKGGYTNFINAFEQKKDNYKKEYDKQCKRIAELKKKNNKTELEKFLSKPQLNKPIRDYDININFNKVNTLSSNEYTNIISFDNVCFSYDNNDNILENIEIGISMKSRYILVGDNGSGKSTFFNLCARKLQPSSGEIVFDNRIRISYFNQNSIIQLPDKLTPIEYLQQYCNDPQTCRAILAKIGFKKMFEGDTFDIGNILISELSGGQKVKLVLCCIQIQNPHVILFDEPTNHLDMYSIDEFINSINEYNGGIVIITHDKYIIENIKNYELLILENKKINKFNGGFDDYSDFILDTE